ncbi:uncharacterized protein LOC121295292 isoform X2 [Polyodon spathula]|uniref:uncharacterized protein LOC121295292 isoform X2 n=1 Tax=Polyodon spathula TaxID=7913 RepID=UPI001B7E95F1|nr:uncharacterized protein LOC121295292 isoform X2 [Polyodon spathula]XP_041075694.1 uncharacterized protein LOC121295292 isoform X2 [Polyodon spathula]
MTENPETDRYSGERRRNLNIRNVQGGLKSCGNYFIMKFLDLYKKHQTKDIRAYLNEALHCIFFLGNIHTLKIKPAEFFTSNELLTLKRMFPDPFEKYATHLPSRTPFSILLDAIVQIKGSQNQNEVMDYLWTFLKDLKVPKPNTNTKKYWNHYTLEATVICICHNERTGIQKPKNFYGASLSCKGKVEQEVIISLSCLETWNAAVAHAVCLADSGGAINLPQTVKCKAFKRKWGTGQYYGDPPCSKCITIFQGASFEPCQLEAGKAPTWPYGHCAETESLSKLLNAEPALCQQVEILNNATNLKRDNVVNNAKDRLVSLLGGKDFVLNGTEFQFFSP